MQSKLPGSATEVYLTRDVLHLRKTPHLRRFKDLQMAETMDYHTKTGEIKPFPNPTKGDVFTITALGTSHKI